MTETPDPTRLKAELHEWAHRHPDQQRFAAALGDAIDRIQSQFDGEVRALLLAQARRTFERHVEILQETQRAKDALRRLDASQKQLLETLTDLVSERPPDATLH